MHITALRIGESFMKMTVNFYLKFETFFALHYFLLLLQWNQIDKETHVSFDFFTRNITHGLATNVQQKHTMCLH